MTKLTRHRPSLLAAVLAVTAWLAVLLLPGSGCGRLEERAWKSQKRPPRVSFDHVRYELGNVRQGDVAEHDFPFRNLGELDLTIDRTRSTSECAATLPLGRSTRARGSGIVHAALDTSGLAGQVRRTITVYTNDPHKRTVLLTLAGTVVADVIVEPKQLYLGSVTRGSLASRTFRLTRKTGRLRIGTPSEDNPYVDLRRKVSPDGAGTVELEVQIDGDAPFGRFDEVVEVPTNSAAKPAVHLRVAGIVRPNVTASPDRLVFGDIPRNGKTVRRLLVRNRGSGPVRVTAAEWEPRFGSVEVDTLRKGRRYRIDATIDEDPAPGDVASVIRLTTDDSEQPRIEIPVEGRVVDEDAAPKPMRGSMPGAAMKESVD